MKAHSILLIPLLLLAACTSPDQNSDSNTQSQTADVSDGVFIHITGGYADAHRVLMPLKMATMMASDKDVLVYLDIDAVNFLVKGAEDVTHDDFESAHTYISKLSEMGVGVYACPTCLKVAGFKPEDLMQGVQVAQKDKFFNFTKGRIITLDY